MKKLLSQVLAGILGLWLATIFVDGVVITTYADSNLFGIPLTVQWQMIIALGLILGLTNYFIAPILKTITLPLRVVTLGLFSFVISAGFIWLLDLIFDEIRIPWIWPLVWTTLLVWLLDLIISKILIKKDL